MSINNNNNYVDDDLSKAEFEEPFNAGFDDVCSLNFGSPYSGDSNIKEDGTKETDDIKNLCHVEKENESRKGEDVFSSDLTDSRENSKEKDIEIISEKPLTEDVHEQPEVDKYFESLCNYADQVRTCDEDFEEKGSLSESVETTMTDLPDGGGKAVTDDSALVNDPDNFVDILGNGLLTKRVIHKGLGRESRPSHGNSVTIHYTAWNSHDIMIDDKDETFVIGDGDMVQAFDLALCLAEIQEEFELRTDSRFAYGEHGLQPDVQPNEALRYQIKLVAVDDAPDYATYNYDDRMAAADKKRERGNYLYRREEFSYAVNSYSRAIKILETDPDFKKAYIDPTKADMFELFVKVTNNLAASQLKLECYDSVIESCNGILNYDANNVKSLFRKGKALAMKGCYDEAITILKKAFELETKNRLIANEIQKCQQLKRAEAEQQARVCKKMFGNSCAADTNGGNSTTTYRQTWQKIVYKYSPYIGAVFVTGLSIFLATVAISKSKGVN